MYQDTGEERYIDMARKCEKKLEQTFSDFYGLHHDVGFMFLPAVVADYRITGNEEAKKAADPRYRHIAMRHADSVMTHFIRKDGSVIHIGEFDPETGAFVKSHGGQGYGEGSAWTRGQGWALYGFVNSYTKSGMEECFRYVLLAQ